MAKLNLPMDLEKVCYKNTPIDRVILRLDFLQSFDDLNRDILPKVLAVIKKTFPIAEPVDMIGKEFQIQGNELKFLDNELKKKWIFHTLQRKIKLIIEEGCFIITYKDYISFDNLTTVLKEISDVFFASYTNLRIKRVGLRYINKIQINDDSGPFEWKKYINEKLLYIFDIAEDSNTIIRTFHNLEMKFDNKRVKFQFGMANPDYPAKIKKKEFLIDLDASCTDILESHEIVPCLDECHKLIQNQFEFAITQELRDYYVEEN